MALSPDPHKSKILEYLKRLAPYSVVEKAISYATDGFVTESSKSGSNIFGMVKEGEELTHSVKLTVISAQEIDAQCTCCSREEMHEQWCHHALALLWRAYDLGFFDSHSGFASSESTYRLNSSSPYEIAEVISEIGRRGAGARATPSYLPNVEVELDLKSDRLGVRVAFDQELQTPTIFSGFQKLSARALDNLLLEVLDEQGSWDEQNRVWYVSSSSGIETVIGLLQEYAKVTSMQTGRKISFDRESLDARVAIEWGETAVKLTMHWLLPNGECRDKESELLGTGPYWAVLDNTIFKISPEASRLASIFPYSSTITLPRSQMGPLLEAINDGLYDPRVIEIVNPELQPESIIKEPVAKLELERRESYPEHFSSHNQLEIHATLKFEYPAPPAKQNLVYLPDRQREREAIEVLKTLGFKYLAEKRRYVASGESALDLVSKGRPSFPASWQVDGIEGIKKSVRFATLAINMSVSSAANEAGSFGGPTDWFDCRVSVTQNNANIPLNAIFKNARADNDQWVRLDCGSYARVPGGGLNQLRLTLGMLDPNFKLSNTIKARISAAQAIGFTRLDDEYFNLALDGKLGEISKRLKDFSSIKPVKAGRSFTGKLRSYQEEGLSWLNFLYEFGLGGILADEMGLGKTVQTLALLQLLKDTKTKQKRLNKPALIIAPTSVITNWCYEIRRFTPKLTCLLLHGPQRKALFNQIPNYDIIVTSYALLRLDRYDFDRHEFSLCVLDEAQNIKNPQAATTKAAKSIRAHRRLALTGTPTENRPLELWSIMDFVMPAYLGSNDFFRNYIEKPILEGGPGVQVSRLLNAKTRPFILRRAKAEVEKDLPPKIESVLHVEMTPSQRQIYSEILEEVRPRVFNAIEKKGVRGASVSILAALLRLRQVCNHPNSIEFMKELPGYDSGKFNLFKEILEEALLTGRKILVFSQFREMLAIMRRWVEESGTNYLYLDGETRDRQTLIDQFNEDPSVRLFLISLKAGGTGLNLTAADTVVIYDPWWNPAVEGQAVDRAHRIGQTKTVSVYRMVTENSVEQKIMELKARKSKVVDVLINNNGLSTLNLSKADIESIFSPLPTP